MLCQQASPERPAWSLLIAAGFKGEEEEEEEEEEKEEEEEEVRKKKKNPKFIHDPVSILFNHFSYVLAWERPAWGSSTVVGFKEEEEEEEVEEED